MTRADPQLQATVLEHARRGVQLQIVLRALLLLFFAATVFAVPPGRGLLACAIVVAAYAVWVVAFTVWFRGGGTTAVRFAWLALFVDLAVLTTLALLTDLLAPESWTGSVLAAAFGLIPVLAATQLAPGVCAAVVGPTVLLSFVAGVITQEANAEPWSSLLLRHVLLAGVGAGCVGLSRIQRSRVTTIAGLLRDRARLVDELSDLETRERRDLAESLHDGALQYVLAARQDAEDARDTGDPAAFDRLDEALATSSKLLRSTVSQLHPAVLERAGLAAALQDLATTTGSRAGFTANVEVRDWPERSPVDALVYRTARELITNVAKHARASTLDVVLDGTGDPLRLTVTDDGVGIPDGAADHSLAEGHIGLPSHAVRVEAAGGRLTVQRGPAGGTVAILEVRRPA